MGASEQVWRSRSPSSQREAVAWGVVPKTVAAVLIDGAAAMAGLSVEPIVPRKKSPPRRHQSLDNVAGRGRRKGSLVDKPTGW